MRVQVLAIVEELFNVVKDKRTIQFELREPAGSGLWTVEVDLAGTVGKVVREPLKFERRPAADGVWTLQQGLERHDDMLPPEALFLSVSREL